MISIFGRVLYVTLAAVAVNGKWEMGGLHLPGVAVSTTRTRTWTHFVLQSDAAVYLVQWIDAPQSSTGSETGLSFNQMP